MTHSEIIVAIMRGDNPPQTLLALSERTGIPLKNLAPKVSLALKRGRIRLDELPWRRGWGVSPNTENTGPETLDDIITELRLIIAAGGKERMQAISELREILTSRHGYDTPLVPNNEDSMVTSLSKIMSAAGQALTDKAYEAAFTIRDTLPDTSGGALEIKDMGGPAPG